MIDWREIAFAAAVIVLMLFASVVYAAPIATAGDERITVILTDEKCALSAVTNLSLRATWRENGHTFEGCYAVARGLVLCYFSDRSVVAIPSQAFQRVTGV